MLACAHVLAMDAKNLLDVVDSIRVRYPDLVLPAHLQPQPQPPPPQTTMSPVPPTTPGSISSSHSSVSITTAVVTTASAATNNHHSATTAPGHAPSTQVIHTKTVTQTTFTTPQHENQYQNSPLDCYQNVGPKQLTHTASPPGSLTHSYTDAPPVQQQYQQQQQQYQQQQIYSNQSGIYDNDSTINSQPVKPAPKKEVIKPPPPIRSSGLVSKMRANFQQQAAAGGSDAANSLRSNGAKDPLNEPLKIVEDDMYTNTAAGIQLPEPVSCTIVQENLITINQQKAVSK